MRQFLTDLFVSGPARHDAEACNRILRTVMFGLSLVVWVPVFAPLYLLAGAHWSGVTVAVSGLVCLLLLFALRWHAPVAIIIQLVVGLLFVALCGLAVLTGGINAPALTWLCAVPIMAVLLGSRWSAAGWVTLCIAALAMFFILEQRGVVFDTEATDVGQPWLHFASLCGIVGCAALLTCVFRRTERDARKKVDEARRVADSANRAKGDFLAKMSHEIRTPMTGVMGMTELALTTELTDEQRNYIEAAKESAESLLDVVNDILDFSRIEAGRLQLRSQGFRIRELMRRTMTLLACRADPDEVTVSWHVDEAVPTVVIADMGRLRQVLINLVGNAIKFTALGEVVVNVSIAEAPHESPDGNDQRPAKTTSRRSGVDEAVVLEISVQDTGVGIPQEQQSKIFDEFEQADGSVARMFGGTGLGLSITRGLVSLMGGRIWLESEVDVGSRFTLTLPVNVGTQADLTSDESSFSGTNDEEEALIQGLRVLVVDDNRTNQVLIRGLLSKQGCDVTVVGSGTEALELTQQVEFDLVFMDIEMPDLDGFETTRALRERELGEARLPIFALTAHVLPNYGLRCLAAGMDGYLSKPLKMSEMMAIIQRIALVRQEIMPDELPRDEAVT